MKKISAIIISAVIALSFASCTEFESVLFRLSGEAQDLTFSPVETHTRKDIVIDEDGERHIIYSEQNKPIFPEIPEETPPADISTRETRLRFIAAGDNIIHSTIIDDAIERADGDGFNFIDMYKYIEDEIKSADIAFINIETPIAGDEFPYTGYPNFNTPKENGTALVDIGIDIVNIANNHMLDKREQGHINNINFWESMDVFLLGGFRDEDDFESVRIYNRNGVSMAFLTYTYGTNNMFLPDGSKMVIPWLDAEVIERQIKAARPQADLLFVSLHWGTEDKFVPEQAQRNLVQMMIENGVDVIIGHHPHVIQETSWADRPDGGQTLTAYSLGNFISAQLYGKNMIGAMLAFDIVKSEQPGEEPDIWIENAEMIPVMTHMNKYRREFQVYKFEDYTKELAEQHYCAETDPEFSYDYIMNLIKDNISPQFLGSFYNAHTDIYIDNEE